MTKLSITLNEEHESFIRHALESGRYLSESEVVADALSEFKVREEIRKARFADLKGKVQVGIEQADRGEFVEFTAGDIIAEGRQRLADSITK